MAEQVHSTHERGTSQAARRRSRTEPAGIDPAVVAAAVSEAAREHDSRLATAVQVATLDGRVTNLEGNVTELRVDVRELKGEVAEVKSHCVDLKGRVNGLEATMNARFDGVNKQFDGVNKQFDGVNKQFDGVNKQFEGVNEQFEGVNRQFDALNRRIDDQRVELLTLMAAEFKATRRENRIYLICAGILVTLVTTALRFVPFNLPS